MFIAREYRVRNSYSNCVWCATETVCWGAAGLRPFEGIKERAVKTGWRGSSMSAVLSAMRDANVPYSHTYNKNYQILYDAVAFGTGAYIEIPGHAVVLVGIDDQGVRIIDNNGSGEVQAWTRQHFANQWVGAACFPRLFNRIRPAPVAPIAPAPSPNTPHPPLNPAEPVVPVQPKPEPIGPPKQPEKPAVDLSPIEKRLAEIEKALAAKPKDGKDGKDGAPAPPADLSPILAAVEKLASQQQQLSARLDKLQTVPPPTASLPANEDLILYYTARDCADCKELDGRIEAMKAKGHPVVITRLSPQDAAVNGTPLIYQPFRGTKVAGVGNCLTFLNLLKQ